MPPCSEKESNNNTSNVLEDHPKQTKDVGVKKDDYQNKNKTGDISRSSSNTPSMFVIGTTALNVCALSLVMVHVIPFCIHYQKLNDSHWLCQVWKFLVDSFPFITKISIEHTYATLATSLACTLGYILYAHRLLSQAAQTTTIMMMPHVPSQLPFFGTSLQFLSNSPWELMQSWHRTYGPIYSFTLLGRTCIAIEKPEHVKLVLQSKIANVKKDVKFAYKPFLPILGRGIVTSEGKSWMKQRLKISNPLKTEILNIIPNATLQAVQRLYLKMQQPHQNLDMGEELRHLTLQVISNTFMGLTAQESDTTFAKMYLPIVEESNIRVWHPERDFMFFMPFFWRHRHDVNKLNLYMETLIFTRWDAIHAGETHNDMLDLVLRHYKKENPNEHTLSPDAISQIRDEFKTFMLAGHETSAAMMTWALYELIQNDDLMEKVRPSSFKITIIILHWLSHNTVPYRNIPMNFLWMNFIIIQITNEAEEVFGKGVDWLADGMDESKLPSRDQLSRLVYSEACLKVNCTILLFPLFHISPSICSTQKFFLPFSNVSIHPSIPGGSSEIFCRTNCATTYCRGHSSG